MNNLPSLFIRTDSEIELSPKVYQCPRLDALGFKPGEICEKLGVSNSWVSLTRKSPLYKQTVSQFEQEINEGAIRAKKMLLDQAPHAAEVAIGFLDDTEHPRMQKEIAVEILKGVGAVHTEEQGPRINIQINDSKLELIMQTLKEIR